jgi:hypothetical protein
MNIFIQIGCLCLIFFCQVSVIYGEKQADIKKDNLNHISVSLLTLGSDQFLYSSWGHSTLRIKDTLNKTDNTYNWGIYDPKTPMFLWKFVKETLPYKLHVVSTKRYINFILSPKRRRMVEDEIILNDKQKKELLAKISWWVKPKNQFYRYHSYKNNCSTQIRDLLNEVFNNQIKDTYGTTTTKRSWRTYWQNYFLHWPITKFAGDLVFNQQIDQKISRWEEMFIPDKLKEHLTSFGIAKPSRVLLDISALQKPRTSAITWFALFFMIPMLILSIGFIQKKRSWQRIGIAIMCFEWAIFSGIFGFTILFVSLFTERYYFHFGANSWILTILDFWLIWPAWKLISNQPINTKILDKIGIAHLIGIGVYLLFWLMGTIQQDVTIPLQSIIPVGILVSILLIATHRGKRFQI